MIDIEVGQVLSLKIRFNNDGLTSKVKHPYLIVAIDEELNFVEVAQMDSLAGKEYKAAMRSNKVIYCDEPKETVIDVDSYVQLDNIYRLELYDGIIRFRRQVDKLSKDKLDQVLKAYFEYHARYRIDENKQVYMTKEEIERIQ